MEHVDNELLTRVWEHVCSIAAINETKGIPQENFVMEESSEFTKEFMKLQRDKSTRDNITAEAIDTFLALLVYFKRHDVKMWVVFEQADIKLERAIARYNENEEV